MSSDWSWFVCCEKRNVPSDKAVTKAFGALADCKVKHVGRNTWTIVVGKSATVDIGLNVEPWVAEETRELVKDHGEGVVDRDAAARWDARYELLFSRDDLDAVLVPMSDAAAFIAELSKGVMFDCQERDFLVLPNDGDAEDDE